MARDFSGGTADYLSVGDVASVDITGTELTIHAFIRPDGNPGGEPTICSKWNQGNGQQSYSMHIYPGGGDVLLCNINQVGGGGNFAIGATPITYGRWHSVALRKNGTGADSLQGILNGKIDSSITSAITMDNNSSAFVIGRVENAASAFDGLIQDLAIWDVALTHHEIQELARGVSPLKIRPGNLRGYWPLNEYDTARDLSKYNAGATMNGTVPPINTQLPNISLSDREKIYLPIPPFIDAPTSTEYPDADTVTVDLQTSSVELEESVDAATVLVDIQPSGVDEMPTQYVDSGTVTVDVSTSGVETRQSVDSATIYVNIDCSGEDVYAPLVPWWDPLPDGTRKWFEITPRKWEPETATRFRVTVRGRI